MRSQRVLITGGAGFLGSYLARALSERGHTVRVFDNNFRGNPDRLRHIPGVELVVGDVVDPGAVDAAVEGVSAVFHLAAINGTRLFYEMPSRVVEVGLAGTLNVLRAAVRYGVSELLFTSSSEVYNEPSRIPTPEDEPVRIPDIFNPRFSYAGMKLAGEIALIHYASEHKFRGIIIRPHNVYGPGMGYDHVIPDLIAKIWTLSDGLKTREVSLPIEGSGEETRDFCYIDDFICGLLLCWERSHGQSLYHVGTQVEVSIRHLVEALAQTSGLQISLVPGPLRSGSPRRRVADISRLRQLGYAPRISLREGLRHTWDAYITDLRNSR